MGVVSLIVVLTLAAVVFYTWTITNNFYFLISAIGIIAILMIKFFMK